MKIGNYIGRDPDLLLYREDEELVSSVDAVGVEVEMENIVYDFSRQEEPPNTDRFRRDRGVILPPLKSFWKVTKDGSLRKGTEFIFSAPHKGANITAALNALQDFINVYRYNDKPIQISDRCSVHVHLDVRDLDNKELSNFILIYTLVERVMFLIIDESRVKNNYCKPLTNSSFKYILCDLLKKQGIDEYDSIDRFVRAVRENCNKYSALNILPIATYGSIEFRHHQGTTDMSAIKRWINVILALKRASVNSVDTYVNIYKEHGHKEVLRTIFKGTCLSFEDFLNRPEVEMEFFRGMSDTLEILDIDNLLSISNRKKSRARPVNTLLHQFKLVNNLVEVTE